MSSFRKCILLDAFLITDSMWVFHFRSCDIVNPRSLLSLIRSIGSPYTRTESGFAVDLLKSTRNSLHLSRLSTNLLAEH